MTDEQTQSTTDSGQAQQTPGEAWREVGQQFRTLGESLASAFKVAWQNEENRGYLQEMQSGLEAMADRVNEAIKETAASPEAQKVRGKVEKGFESARTAGEQALHEARPHLLSALHQVNVEIQKVIARLEGETPPAEADAAEADNGG